MIPNRIPKGAVKNETATAVVWSVEAPTLSDAVVAARTFHANGGCSTQINRLREKPGFFVVAVWK